MEGKVKFFLENKGFGFIIGDDDVEYFVHTSEIENQEEIRQDDQVSFTPGHNDRGNVAKKVLKV